MSYLVLARKWRPRSFDEVVGQGHVTRTLGNAIEMDRVAHAFLFTGVRGVGKTSMARILAKSLNCVQGPTATPCGECDSCRAIAAGTSVDVIEIDGASNNSVEDIRELRETVPYRPALGKHKIYVIDEVHMLSTSAFNALLKTLEEPPEHVKFIFATTEPHKIPATILSRCQRYDFRRIPTSSIVERIEAILGEEGIEAEPGALAIIGREAEGSMRDALSILDQVLATGAESISAELVADLLGVVSRRVNYDLSAALLAGDARRSLEVSRDVDRQGFDIAAFSRGFLDHLRNLVVAGVCRGEGDLLDLPDDEIVELTEQAGSVSVDTLHRIFKQFGEAHEEIARSTYPLVLLEAALARIADAGSLVSSAEILERLEAIAGRGAPGAGGPGRGGGAPRKTATAPAREADERPPSGAGGAAAPAEEETEDRVERRLPIDRAEWERVVEKMADRLPGVSSALERGVPSRGPDGGDDLLVLEMDEKDRFAAAILGDGARQRQIGEILSEIVGRPIRFAVELADLGRAETAAKRKLAEQEKRMRLEEEARSHPVIAGAVRELGGIVASIEPIDEARRERGE